MSLYNKFRKWLCQYGFHKEAGFLYMAEHYEESVCEFCGEKIYSYGGSSWFTEENTDFFRNIETYRKMEHE